MELEADPRLQSSSSSSSSSVEEPVVEDDEEMEYIPMKPCLATGRSRSLPFIKQPLQRLETLKNSQGSGQATPTLKQGLQFLESSHNEIVYKTKKVEYILEKERRARRGSESETNKLAKFKAWITSKINGKKNLRTADESVRQAEEALRTAAEMICRLDDTMTQEEENLCQRANILRRRSEFTFKTMDNIKHQNARRIQSNGDVEPLRRNFETEDTDEWMKRREKFRNWGQKRRKSSVSLDDNFLSQVTEESLIVHHS